MAQRMELISLVLVVVTVFLSKATAQSGCTNVIISMSPCLNYITGNSSTPSSRCCTQLASVVQSSPQCLCEALNGGGSSLGINVNQTQALALPGACNVQTPPLRKCKNAAAPADSPAGTTPDSPSGTGSKTVPSTQDGSSDGNSMKLSATQLFSGLLAAGYATFTLC